MATRTASRHRSIPITVKVEKRTRPAKQPTSAPADLPSSRQAPLVIQPTTTPAWSEAHRRRIMWISVGVGSLAIIIGWVTLFSAQIRGNAPTFFGDAARLVQDIKWPWEKAPLTIKEQEIRQLEEQVFPQFQ